MAVQEALTPRALSQGLRALQVHRRAHKYQLVAFGILAAVVLAVVEGDFVAAVEVLVFVVPVEPPVGLVVLRAEMNYSLKVVMTAMNQLQFTNITCKWHLRYLRS